MLSFIHVADIHLDSPLSGLVDYDGAPPTDDIRAATRQALENLVSLIISEKIPLLIISGDIYDGAWKDFSTGLFFARHMQRLKDAGVLVAIVRGNHDAENTMTKTLILPENVKIFSARKPETWELPDLGVALHGQSYATRDVYENLAKGFPEPVAGLFNIGILHCLISGMQGYAPYAPCTIDDLAAKGYDYWALGHVHEYNRLRESPIVVYAGCTQGRHIRETGPRGCVLVEMDSHDVRTEFIALDTVRWMEVVADVGGAKTVEQAAEMFKVILTKSMAEDDGGRLMCIRVILTGRTLMHGRFIASPDIITANIRAVTSDVTRGRALVEKVKIQTHPEIDFKALAQHDTPVGELIRYLDSLAGLSKSMEDLGLDLTPIKSILSGSGLDMHNEDLTTLLHDARDILITLLSDEDISEGYHEN